MSKKEMIRRINLQLFAEGTGDSGTGADGTPADGMPATSAKKADKNPLANVKYGIQEDAHPANVQTKETDSDRDAVMQADRSAEFEKLIKGEYKDLYDARIQDTIQKRLKSTKETVDRYNALAPTLEMLSKKYGVDASDIDALNKAIEDDSSYYEEEALEKGITVDQLKYIRKMERENAEIKKQIEEHDAQENANRTFAFWMDQAEHVKGIYPGFDFETEMQNPRFFELLRNNVDVRTAYEVLHKDEIIPAAMQFTAQKVGQQLTNKIIANGARPTENGISNQSSAVVKSDVSQLSKADRAEIIRRVAGGEKIRF